MEIRSTDVGDIKVVEIEGNLDTNTSPNAQERIDQLIQAGAIKILFDFEKVNYISSAGLRVLLATAKLLRKEGGDLRLCNMNHNVQDVFEISGFSSILKVFDNKDDAIDGF